MPILQRIAKPTTRRGKRYLESVQPKLLEDTKKCIFIRGATANQISLQAMKDFTALKKPYSVFFNKKNDIRPFEDPSSLEFFSQKNNASLFMFGSHNKKRPNNLVIGRCYDYHILDMVELGIENFKSLQEFKVKKIPVGTKPMLIFSGEPFDQEPEYQRLKNLLIDFFHGADAVSIRLQGLEHVLMFTAADGKVYFRSYRVLMKKSGTRIPRVELDEIGPHMDFSIRRTKLASEDLFKLATKQPRLQKKKQKNIKRDPLGRKMGRIHMQRQDFNKLQTRKMKGLKKNDRFRKKNVPVKTQNDK